MWMVMSRLRYNYFRNVGKYVYKYFLWCVLVPQTSTYCYLGNRAQQPGRRRVEYKRGAIHQILTEPMGI